MSPSPGQIDRLTYPAFFFHDLATSFKDADLLHYWVGQATGLRSSISRLTDRFNSFRCSRGIGLEFTKQLVSSAENTVIATARNPSSPLTDVNGPGKLHILPLDVSNEESVKTCAEDVKKITGRIDYLLNSAGKLLRFIVWVFNRI